MIDENYVNVASRIATFRDKYPQGSLQPLDLAQPYKVETIGQKTFIVVVAAAYRDPDDPRPGIGMAAEPFPGQRSFTRDSELQNAETSAWGRAIVAALAADTRKGIASAEEVRNRRTDDEDRDPTTVGFEEDPSVRAWRLEAASETATVEELQGLWRAVSAAGKLLSLTALWTSDGSERMRLGDFINQRGRELSAASGGSDEQPA